ncbi:MAG: PTS galactitol transporter subunit IIB [Oscillospiraceae bacterium]|nr:PTS galactitol transporter subunit IIB [Oscillospiraceae bacterium]
MVACGTGGVTSKNIAMKIEKYLKSKGIDCSIDTCKVVEVRSKTVSLKPDLVVSSTQLPDVGVPRVVATSLLTGIGVDKVYNEIYDILTK